MESKSKYLRLSSNEKETLIKRSLNGEKIVNICKEAGVSRTIFYKWLNKYKKSNIKPAGRQGRNQKSGSISKSAKPKKHWRKQKLRKEQEIIRLWLKNPEATIREIAKKTGVSVGGAFNIVKKHKVQAQNRGREIRRYKKKSYKIYTAADKRKLIERYYKGESIVRISAEAGISRTIFYKWLKAYGKSGESEDVLVRKTRRAENHWRFIPGVRDMVADLVLENPDLSLSQLAKTIKSEGKSISRSGLYYILRSMNLTTPEDRLAYAHSQSISAQGYGQWGRRQAVLAEATNYLPRFAVFTLFWMFVSLVLFNSISKSVEKTADIAHDLTPTIARMAEKTGEEVVRRAHEVFEPIKSEQDLAWGALAANVSKDTLKPGEEAQIGFGVVDSLGNTVCSADIRFGAYHAGKSVATESVGVPSGSCSRQGTSNDPDYIGAVPAAGQEGEYGFIINAETYEGAKKFERSYIVADKSLFEIKRSSYPSRIYPVASYPVKVEIKANQDFKGTISEVLPDGIFASQISGRGVLFRKNGSPDRVIKWGVNLKKGEAYKISYILRFPQVWPEFYEIGPIELTDHSTGAVIYREARYWQIVADAVE